MKTMFSLLTLLTAIFFFQTIITAGTVRLQYGNKQVIDCVFSGWPYCYGREEVGSITYFGGGIIWERYFCKIPLIYFADSSIEISNATIKVFLLDKSSYENSFQLTINRLSQPFGTSVGSILAPTYYDILRYDTVSVSGSYTGWVEFNITDLVRDWISKEFPNDGFVIRMLDSTYASTGICESMNSDSTKRPILEITGPTLFDTLITGYEELQNGGRWIRTNTRGNAMATSLTFRGSTIYAALYGVGSGSIDSSTDAGNSWSSILHTSAPISSFSINDAIIIAGTLSGGLFRSTDSGHLWNEISEVPLGVNWSAIYFVQNRFFAAFSGGIFVSSDNGATWQLTLVDTTNYHRPNGFAFDGTNIFVSTIRGAYRSTDQGLSWSQMNIGINDTNLTCIQSDGNQTVVGTVSGKVFLSSDHGENWNDIDHGLLNGSSITALFISGNHVFAGTINGDLYLTRNYGWSWKLDTMLLGGGHVSAFTSEGIYLFTGIWGGIGGVWRSDLSQLTNVKEELSQNTPTQSILQQNYPNPFNPKTIISYQLTSSQRVSLKVFDMLGRELRTLVDEMQEPGIKSVEFNAEHLSSGLYFYRLQTGKYTETKKLVLLK